MDPISSSSYNLSFQHEDIELEAISTSVKSLGQYEQKNCKNLLPQIIAAAISTANHLVVGLALAYSAILVPHLEDKNSEITISKDEISWIVSVYALTAPVGALMGGYLMGKVGRLNTLKISMVPGVVGWVLIAVAPNISFIIAGRFFTGIASTLSTNPAIVYITEIGRKDMRGSLVVMGPAYVSLGMIIGFVKGWLINWRTISWLCNIYTIIPFFLLFLIPESPSWLISKGRIEEAKKSLTWFHKHQPQPENQAKSFAEIQFTLLMKEDTQKKLEAGVGSGTFQELLKPTGYKPLLIISGVFLFQQFSGIYIFLFYSVSFFEEVGTTVNPYIASIWIGVIRLVMSILNYWLLKYFTRRSLIMVSSSGMAVCTFLSGLFTFWIKNGTTTLTWLPVVFLLFYVVTSLVGLLIIPWTMTAELFPLKIRSLAHSISMCIANFLLFLAVQSYFGMKVWFGGSAGVQWFFSAVSLSAVAFIFVFLPETHKKKLSEIEDYFKHNTIYLRRKKRVRVVQKRDRRTKATKNVTHEDLLLEKL